MNSPTPLVVSTSKMCVGYTGLRTEIAFSVLLGCMAGWCAQFGLGCVAKSGCVVMLCALLGCMAKWMCGKVWMYGNVVYTIWMCGKVDVAKSGCMAMLCTLLDVW